MFYSQVQTVILLHGISLINGFFHVNQFGFDHCVIHQMQGLQTDATQWIEQRLDHFNDSDSRTFKMKYYKIMKSWKPEGPILLFLQGSYALPPPKIQEHGKDTHFFVDELAVDMGAAYFLLEHRYYGRSRPFADRASENLAFLTSRQALEDAVHLLKTIKKTPEFQNSKVIVVGGFYAGNLATWMKLLYPQLIDAVLASSAPVLAKKDFNEYYETITDVFRTYGSQECVNKITEKFNSYHELLQTPEGIEKLKKEYNACDDNDMTVLENQQYFYLSQMYVCDVKTQFGIPGDISSYCQTVNSSKLEHRIPYDKYNDPWVICVDFDFNTWVNFFNLDKDGQYWWHQLCTELGYFDTTSSSKQMFGKSLPADFHHKCCRFLFGEFNEERLDASINNINRMFGGLTPNVTNVVFVNGDMDPWNKLGIVHDLSDNAPAIVIEGAGHCHDFYPLFYNYDSVKEARERIKKILKKWIGQA